MLVSLCQASSSLFSKFSSVISPDHQISGRTEIFLHRQCDIKKAADFALQLLPTRDNNSEKTLFRNGYGCCSSSSSREASRFPLLLLWPSTDFSSPLKHQRCVVINNVHWKSLLSRRESDLSVPHCLAAESPSPPSSSSSSELARRSSVAAERSSSRDAVGLGSSSSPIVTETVYADGNTRSSISSSLSLEPNGAAAAGIPSKASTIGNWNFEYPNTVGILGGLAPLATVEFMRKIVEATDAEDERDPIPLVLCSDSHIRKSISPSLLVPRANNMSSSGAAETDLVSVELLLERRRFLEKAGAKCIVMPCHVSHLWYDQLAEGCSVPFLHMADCVVEELKAANLQPLEAGSKPKIGVLGTQATIAAEFYQEKLRSQGFDVALPDQATMEHAVIPGIAALQRGDMEGARNLLRIAVQILLVNAVNLVLLACHNTPVAFSADDPVLRKCIDPTEALARATVQWSRSMKGIRT